MKFRVIVQLTCLTPPSLPHSPFNPNPLLLTHLLQALDSEFGPGTPAHACVVVVTTVEVSVFTALAGHLTRPYPLGVAEAMVTVSMFMIIYTWVVLFMELLFATGLALHRPAVLPSPRLSAPSSPPQLSAQSTRLLARYLRPGPSSASRSQALQSARILVKIAPKIEDDISSSGSGSEGEDGALVSRGALSSSRSRSSSVVVPMDG